MTCTTDIRLRAIHRRARQYRAQQETRQLTGLTACSLLLLCGILALLRSVQSPGVAAVADGYGAVLLQDGAGPYVVIGLAAFVAGVTATVLCAWLKKRAAQRAQDEDSRE